MKKALLTIVSITLLLPHHSFAMQQHNKTSQEKLTLSLGSNSIYPNLYGSDVQPSAVNHETKEQNTEFTALLEQIKEQEKTIAHTQKQLKRSLAAHAEINQCFDQTLCYAFCISCLCTAIIATAFTLFVARVYFGLGKH